MDGTRFRCYKAADGGRPVIDWVATQPGRVRAAAYAVIEALSHRSPMHWRRKPYAELRSAACTGLGEIRFEEPRGVHFRILGMFDADRSCFTLLHGFRKSTDPEYRHACPEAQRRRKETDHDENRATDLEIPDLARSRRGDGGA